MSARFPPHGAGNGLRYRYRGLWDGRRRGLIRLLRRPRRCYSPHTIFFAVEDETSTMNLYIAALNAGPVLPTILLNRVAAKAVLGVSAIKSGNDLVRVALSS